MPRPRAIELEYEGRSFEFQVHERELVFGSAGTGQYFWMDGRQLRQGRGGPNFRPCVDLWWHAAEVAGEADLLENEITLVLAECYPLVNTARAMQDVYVDAHLHRVADRDYSFVDEDGIRRQRSERTYLLPEDECDRLRELARSHSGEQVRAEIEGLFLGRLPPRNEMPAYQEAAQMWIGNGITTLRRDGREGFREYTEVVDQWIRRLRRQSGQDRVRMFLNMFAYQCKVAFYLCYASAWVGILQRLAQHGEPNLMGERFMRLWHHQNRAPQDERGVHRDAFCGQVLALHPLSGIVLTSPEHLAVIGPYVGHPDYDQLQTTGEMANCPQYWDVVATILIAVHEYEHARQRWEQTRGQVTHAGTDRVAVQTRDDAVASAGILFEDYAAARGIVCPACAGSLSYVDHELVDSPEEVVTVRFVCQLCQRERPVTIATADPAV